METQQILDRLEAVLRGMGQVAAGAARDDLASLHALTRDLVAQARDCPGEASDRVDLLVHCVESILGMRDRDGITHEQFRTVALDTLSHLRHLLAVFA